MNSHDHFPFLLAFENLTFHGSQAFTGAQNFLRIIATSVFYYLSTVIPDTSKPYTIAYGGVNSDSYLDAILIRQDAESGNFTLAIFDPEDPEHPYLSINGSTQSGQGLRLVSPGELGFYYPASTSPSGSEKAFV
ncbi:hypothetical protein [Varibaculum massiliense]|uniref:hypothetical protein n=1 Tax=Varibaculum massiliense TaxID=1852372 RepID=UPI00288B920D|nr:hypothetical protein [Varibaculum massiliense]